MHASQSWSPCDITSTRHCHTIDIVCVKKWLLLRLGTAALWEVFLFAMVKQSQPVHGLTRAWFSTSLHAWRFGTNYCPRIRTSLTRTTKSRVAFRMIPGSTWINICKSRLSNNESYTHMEWLQSFYVYATVHFPGPRTVCDKGRTYMMSAWMPFQGRLKTSKNSAFNM